MANFNATTGTDNNTQAAGTDTVTVSNTNQIQAGDFFDGAGGTDTIVIAGLNGVSVDLSGAGTGASTGFHNYEGLTFDNTSGTSTATLSSAQFGGILISNSLAVTGAAGTQAVVVNMPAAGSFDASGWTFTSWTAGTDTITINGSSGTDTVAGSSQNETLYGNGGTDTLNGGGGSDVLEGGAGADSLTGGSGSDVFNFAAGDTALTTGGSGTAGTVSGYDVITDFVEGATAATSEKIKFSGSTQIAANDTVNGSNSSLLLHTGDDVSAHSITNGIITFSKHLGNFAAIPLTTLADVAAVTQYLQDNNGKFATGDVVAFTATISGVTHTYIFRSSASSLSNDVLIDLVNVNATSIAVSGDQISVTGTSGAPPSITSIAENAGGGINASEGADGTAVVVSLTDTGAVATDALTINWGGQTVNYVLTAADITAGSATVTVPAGTITTQGNGTFNVTAKLNAGPDSSPVSVTVDTVLPAVPTDTNGATNQVAENAANGAPVGLTANSTDTNAVTYSITSDSSGGAFTIHTSTGVVTLADASLLNYEAATSHTITIRAADAAGNFSSQAFAIAVTNVNDNPVVGPTYADGASDGSVAENASNGTPVGITASASDADGGATVTYGLSDDAGGRFTIDSVTGIVTVADGSLLDAEAATSHNITVLATSSDGSTHSQTFTIAVTNVNDAPVLAAIPDQAIDEEETVSATAAEVQALIDAAVSDADAGDSAYVILTLTDSNGVFTYNSSTDGDFSYTPPTGFARALTVTVTAYDESDVASNVRTFTINVTNVNDAPVVDLNGAGGGNNADRSFFENGAEVAIAPATISITDPDDINLVSASIVLTNAKPGDSLSILGALPGGITSSITTGPGTITVALSGTASRSNYQTAIQQVVFNNPGDNPDTTDRNITVSANDGTGVVNAAVTMHVVGVNDLPANSLPGTQHVEANTATAISGLSIADPDAGAGTLTTTLSVAHGTLAVISAGGAAVSGSGTASVTLTGTLSQINTTLAAAGNLVYTGAHDFFGTDTLNVLTNDNGNTGAGGTLTDTDNVTINVDTLINGTPGDDSYIALPGQEMINGFGGIDSVTFNFKLVEATVGYEANKVIIDGPGGSHTVFTGFEVFNFTDGTVNNNDATRLVDDLFYYSKYHDVWNAHVDADAHFESFGRDEGRDPSFFFSTVVYRSANPDVAASGVNPLDHFGLSGWLEGRVPSIHFDPVQYLAANPDVAAAGVDPLGHYLQFGYQEGRLPFAPSALIAADGFDYVYYLQHNPDVAASGVDPLQHFNTFGWHEGRNPNAWFDTAGYLAHYADVAASGVNPLDHYEQFGWKEGRDPSAGFDTAGYLAANPDVAAAHVDPLDHFLKFGIHEGRQAVNDGVWH